MGMKRGCGPRGRRFSGQVAAVLGLAVLVFIVWASGVAAGPASVVYRGSKDHKQIALTFDDNTNVPRALATLRALEKSRVRATLFVIGDAVKAYPAINAEIVKGMAAGFFEVGDHSKNHPVLTKLSASAMAAQIGAGTAAFRQLTGARTVPLYRPPYGTTNTTVHAVGGSKGFLYEVLWDVDPRDWAGGSAQSIADHVVGHAHNGAIVVMHLSGPHTAEAVPLMAARLRAKGYELVTVSEMLKGDRLFLDVRGGTEEAAAIARMVAQGFMSGYDGNYFGPGDTITRAQVAKVATLVGGIHTPAVEHVEAPTFVDVPGKRDGEGNPIAYPFDFVEEAAAAGLVVGSVGPDGAVRFNPGGAITRVQFAQILARMVRQLKGVPEGAPGTTPVESPAGSTGVSAYPDAPAYEDVPAYAAEDVRLVAGLGLMTGAGNTAFSPWAGAKRGVVALAMSRYLDLPPAPPAATAE
jgi:peptidoglycan/xylan/chitin deacetylase (PgdA/CDA1 family)